jgi:type III secretion protein C
MSARRPGVYGVFGLLCALLAGSPSRAASADAWENQPYPYSVVSENISDVIRNFGYNAGIRVSVSPDVRGVVSGRSGHGTAREFLDDVTRGDDLDWYSDGTVLYVSPAAAEQTIVVPMHGFPFAVMKIELEQQKLFDARFRLSPQIGGDAAIVSGPPSFVAVIKQAIEARTSSDHVPQPGRPEGLVILRGSQSTSIRLP